MQSDTPSPRGKHRPGKPPAQSRHERFQRVQCTGITKKGKQCGRWADTGHTMCHYHRQDRKACTATREDGSPCDRSPMTGTDLCYAHTPGLMAAEGATAKRCTGTRPDGSPCRYRPLKGLEVCKAHGGGTKIARRKAAARIEEEKARKALAILGKPVPVLNALLELQLLAGEARQWQALLQEKVFEIDVANWRYASQQDLEQVHGLVQLFERAMDRSQVTLSALARVQVDDRLAAIQEATLLMILSALRDAIAEAGLDAAIAAVIKTAFAKRVRVLRPGEVVSGQKAITDGKDKGKAA